MFDINSLTTNPLFQGGIAISVGTYILYQLKGIPLAIWHFIRRKFVYTSFVEEQDSLYNFIEEWLSTFQNKNYRNVYANFINEADRKDKDTIKFKQKNDYFFIGYKKRWIKISQIEEKMEKSQDIFNIHYRTYSLSGFFAKKAINSLLIKIASIGEKKQKERGRRTMFLTNGYFEDIENYMGMNFDQIFLDKKQKELLIEDLDKFTNNRKWYDDRGFLYKRGYLFYGPPGTGKSSLVKAIAQHTNRDIYYISLKDISNDNSLYRILNQISKRSIVLFEDIDVMGLKKRNIKNEGKNKKKETPNLDGLFEERGVTLSGLLNMMDGLLAPNDIIFIMTSNNPAALDTALIRDGRIDMRIEISYPSKETVEEYLNFFYERKDIKLEKLSGDISFASIKEICIKNKYSYENAVIEINRI